MYLRLSNFLGFIVLGHGLGEFSQFRTTKVLIDDCSDTDALSVFDSTNIFTCASGCSTNANCRRFMTCSQPNGVECSLFYDGENCETLQSAGCSCYIKTFGQFNGTTICPIGLYGDNCEHTVEDCSEGNDYLWSIPNHWVRSYIKPRSSTTSFEVTCTFKHGGAILFMSRDTRCQVFSFNRNITEYINGFGDPNSDHWLGLTKTKNILGNHLRNKLSVLLINNINLSYCENYYSNFTIGQAVDGYPINLGKYETWPSQKCDDSLTGAVNIEGMRFSAPGSDQTYFNCAGIRQGGWWYADDSRCSESYFMGSRDAMLGPTSLGSFPQQFVGLLIRPVN